MLDISHNTLAAADLILSRSAKDDAESRLNELSRLIALLPEYNRNSLKVLAKYLREVHDDSSVNKMHASNLVRTISYTLANLFGTDWI